MQTRVVILDLLDPAGDAGLAESARRIAEKGIDEVVPIATGVVEWSDSDTPTVRPFAARAVDAALREALAIDTDVLLLGALASRWQVKPIGRTLLQALPEIIVYAPDVVRYPLKTGLSRRQAQALLPEATLAIATTTGTGSLVGSAETTADAARSLAGAGAYAAWVLDDADHTRALDSIARGESVSVLDYPLRESACRLNASAADVAALLADGLALNEAIDSAHRSAAAIGASRHAASLTRTD